MNKQIWKLHLSQCMDQWVLVDKETCEAVYCELFKYCTPEEIFDVATEEFNCADLTVESEWSEDWIKYKENKTQGDLK